MIFVFLFVSVAALKIISFAHVMENVRDIMKRINDKSAKLELLGEHEINSQV